MSLSSVVAYSFYQDRFYELFLGFFRDIVLILQSCSCRDRSVLCRDIKFIATSFSYFSSSENCRDLFFFLSRPIFYSLLFVFFRDIIFFYRNTIWLACTAEIELCVVTDSEDVATNIFTFNFSTLLRQSCYVVTFFLWLLNNFVVTKFPFVAIEFLL